MQPKLIIFAGANGAGKTTVAKALIPQIDFKEFVNADEIARGFSPFNSQKHAMSAGRLAIERRKNLLKARESFVLETTLSGRGPVGLIKNAQAFGFLVEMNYIFCADVCINIERIKNRVQQGGHDVPDQDVMRRYRRSLSNWVHCVPECDIMKVYDTTDGGVCLINEDAFVYDLQRWQRFINIVESALGE